MQLKQELPETFATVGRSVILPTFLLAFGSVIATTRQWIKSQVKAEQDEFGTKQ